MLWKPINFQGVVVIEQQLIDQLQRYLEEKRARLSHDILQVFDSADAEGGGAATIKLEDTVEKVRVRIDGLKEGRTEPLPTSWQAIRESLNEAAWEYVEVLEGCVVELLQQLDHVRLDRLTTETLQAVGALRRMLMEKILEAADTVKALDSLLRSVKELGGAVGLITRLKQLFGLSRVILDRFLVENLDKTGQFLESRDRELRESYSGYQKLNMHVQESMRKFEGYAGLKQMEEEEQERFREIYRLLKMWAANTKGRSIQDLALNQLIRGEASYREVTVVFKAYSRVLSKVLFDLSRRLKGARAGKGGTLQQVKTNILQDVDRYSREIHSLGSTINRYREFLLKTDPNPYVRSRWGFSEWVVGPEPRETRQLVKVGFAVESLDSLYQQLRQSLLRPEQGVTDFRSTSSHYDIQSALHEMGQPLASRAMLRKRADALIEGLKELDELGSCNPFVVDYVAEVLGRGLRADWKYHVLHQIPAFHQLYIVHKGIMGPLADREEKDNLDEIKAFVRKVEDWVKGEEVQKRIKEVMEGVEMINAHLQAFYDSLKQIPSELSRDWIRVRKYVLLQYRYHFGSFCQHFCDQQEGNRARSLFMSVDQHLELIENRLNDIEEEL